MPVLRSRFLNPGKIALLHVIGLYCDGAVPAEATIEVLSFITSRLVPTFTPTKATSQFAVSLEDLQQLLDIPTPESEHKTLWQSFSLILCLDQNLDHLFDFFGRNGRLDRLFSTSHRAEGSNDQANSHLTRLDPTSLFGTFVRRAQLEFDRLTFHEAVALWRDYVRFRAPATDGVDRGRELLHKRDVDNLEAFIGDSDGRIAAILNLDGEAADPGQVSGKSQKVSNIADASVDSSRDNGQPERISKDDMEKLLEFQVTKMQKLGVPLPKDMKRHLSQTLTTKEDSSGLTHYARFLDSWFEGDYHSSFENLHRYYDYALNGKDRSRYPYALLNMAILQADFGCHGEALAAIHETIATAREHKDMACLNFSLSWLHHFRSTYQGNQDDKPDGYMLESESNGLAFIKAKAQENKMWSVMSSTLLSEAKLYLDKGRPPRQAFVRLVESAELNNRFNLTTIESSLMRMQSSVYSRVGIESLATAYDNIILQCYKTEAEAQDLVRARCRLAYTSALAGNYAAADASLAAISPAYQHGLKLHQLVTAYTALIAAMRHLCHNNLRAAQPLLDTLHVAQTSDPDFRAPAILLAHDHLVRGGNLPEAFERLDAHLAMTERTDADVALRARLLAAKARLFGRAGRAQKGLTLALRAAAVAREAKIMPVLFDAVGALGTVLIVIGNSREAEALVESVVYTVAETGDVGLLASLQSTLADACWTSAVDESTGREERIVLTRRALGWLSRALEGYVKLEDARGQCEMADKAEMLCRVLGEKGKEEEFAKKRSDATKVLAANA